MKWIPLLLIGVLFSGCADSVEEPQVGLGGDLADGKGGIKGLLIDDRFRPILDAEILLQPNGLIATPNENGEFGFQGLEPGTYTLRVSSTGHEASPQRVTVEAGFYAESEILARRTASIGSTLVTYEYAVFIDCSISAVLAFHWSCSTDQSGDSYRDGFTADYSNYDNVTYLVIEMLASKEGRFELDVWDKDHPDGSLGMLANDVFTGDYTRMMLTYGETNTEHAVLFENSVWENTGPFDTELIVFGELSEETSQIDPFLFGGGVGVNLAITGKFLHSLFINEPETPVEDYCVYCV